MEPLVARGENRIVTRVESKPVVPPGAPPFRACGVHVAHEVGIVGDKQAWADATRRACKPMSIPQILYRAWIACLCRRSALRDDLPYCCKASNSAELSREQADCQNNHNDVNLASNGPLNRRNARQLRYARRLIYKRRNDKASGRVNGDINRADTAAMMKLRGEVKLEG